MKRLLGCVAFLLIATACSAASPMGLTEVGTTDSVIPISKTCTMTADLHDSCAPADTAVPYRP